LKIEDIINRKDLKKRLDGDMELYRELADIFFTEHSNLLKNIENAITDTNSEKLTKEAHTIKGAVSNFSAPSTYDAAYELEMIGKKNELHKAKEAFDKLKNEINIAIKAMKLLQKEDFL